MHKSGIRIREILSVAAILRLLCTLVYPERENVPVKTEYISVKYMTC